MEIKASDVKALREKTGAGMMECKNALASCNGDFAAAEKQLKEKGLAAVAKRADRATNEGKVFIKIKDNTAVLVELASETDFVARNPDFIAIGGEIADIALAKGITEPTPELSGMVTDLATKIRENMSLKRLMAVKANANQSLTSYIHGDGAIGVVVKMGADKAEVLANEEFKAFAFSIALHIAAFNPLALDRTKLDPAIVKEQEEILRVQMGNDEKLKGKPVEMTENILKGKVNKYIADICLVDQGYVKDEKVTVAKAVADLGKQLGANITIDEYVYFKVGA